MSEPANTPDDFPPAQFDLIAFCDACGLTIQELPSRLRCSACGRRGCSIRIVYTGAGGYKHG